MSFLSFLCLRGNPTHLKILHYNVTFSMMLVCSLSLLSLSGYPFMSVPENSLLSLLYVIISLSIIYQILILETLKSIHI